MTRPVSSHYELAQTDLCSTRLVVEISRKLRPDQTRQLVACGPRGCPPRGEAPETSAHRGLKLGQVGSRSDIHGLVDAVPDEELDAVRAVLNAVRAKDGFESLSEDDLERLRASVRRGLGDEASRRAARELAQMAQEDELGYE